MEEKRHVQQNPINLTQVPIVGYSGLSVSTYTDLSSCS